MIGSFLTRGLVMVLGYAYPAYECYKTVEMNKPDIEQLRFWCQYWILVAILTVCERIGDTFVSWVPMYSEAKLAFFIYLWYPRTKGTMYVYDTFFKPYIAKHEPEIDRNLLEMRTRAGDIAFVYWQRTASYCQARFFEILQYVSAQSTTRPPRPAQPQQQGTRARKHSCAPNRKPTSKITTPNEEPLSPSSSSSTSSSHDEAQESSTSQSSSPAAPTPVTQKSLAAETSNHGNVNKTDAMQMEEVSASANENVGPPPVQETVMEEEASRVTRTRLRKARSAQEKA